MSEPEKIILPESDEAAQLKTVTGWVSRDGIFYGGGESTARYAGSTHRKCDDCENVYPDKYYLYCPSCRRKRDAEAYLKKETRKWNGSDPLCIYGDDTYFFSLEEVVDYAEEVDMKPEDLALMLCVEQRCPQVDAEDLCCDVLPEDGEAPDTLVQAVAVLNEVIKHLPPLSWTEGRYAADITEFLK